MARVLRRADDAGTVRLSFWCPGCKSAHGVPVNRWQFNGDFEKPTLSPSVMVNEGDDWRRCHSFVESGQIKFLTDCFHSLAGQTIDMIDIEDHMVPDNWPLDWDAPTSTWRPSV